MRSIKSADQFVFSKAEYLTGQQISSYFSRLALKNRKTDMNDLVAAKQEANDEEITGYLGYSYALILIYYCRKYSPEGIYEYIALLNSMKIFCLHRSNPRGKTFVTFLI